MSVHDAIRWSAESVAAWLCIEVAYRIGRQVYARIALARGIKLLTSAQKTLVDRMVGGSGPPLTPDENRTLLWLIETRAAAKALQNLWAAK